MYPPNFPFQGTIINNRTKNEELIPVFLIAAYKVMEWWDTQPEAKSMRLRNYMDQVKGELELYSDAWSKSNSWKITAGVKEVLDNIAPKGLYFGAHPLDLNNYGYWPSDWLETEWRIYS